jgi:hypothetical protein
MNKTILLVIAMILLVIGLFKPSFIDAFNPKPSPSVVVDDSELPKPSDELIKKSTNIIKALSVSPERKTDGKKLASLYKDIAELIALDGENELITNTDEIRQANKLAGVMLKLDIKNKYPDLPESAQAMIVSVVGDDQIPLTTELRAKAIDSFMALAWACNEGSK